ncbi:hypothetical protein SOX05_08510 [Pseudomonas putida]|nr:hypothetical protein [Pseudomonas putida]MDY4319302.1 hypothetical protein [Pseudomonas putida]
MKKIFNALLLASSLLFASANALAGCGMNENDTQVKVSGEICNGNLSIELMGKQNPAIIQNNPFLKDNEIQTTYNQKMQNDPDFKKEVESNVVNLKLINTGMIFFLLICIGFGVIQNVAAFSISGMTQAKDDEGRYSLKKTIISYALLVVFFTLPYGPTGTTGAGWLASYLVVGKEKFENYARRGGQYLFENYVIDQPTDTNKNNITVHFSKTESEQLITKMVIAYTSMRQTDKAFFAALDSRYAKMADPATFYHYVDNRIEMYRTPPNSAVVDYTGGTHIIPTPNLNFLGDSYKDLNLVQYVTSDIGALEANLTTARRVLMEEIGTKSSSTAIDNVIDVIMLMSRTKILMAYYKEIQTDGTLAAISKELLRQACFDSMEADRSKQFLAYYKDGAKFAGNPFCLHPTDNTGANFEVVGLGAVSTDMDGRADRTQQNEWFAKQVALTQDVINKRHALLEKIAAIRLSIALTDTTKQTAKLASSSQTGFMIAGTEYLWNIEDKQRVINSLFVGSGEQIISKGAEANLINYEFLNKGGKKAFAESGLRFGYYTQLMYAEFKRGRSSDTHNMTTDAIIQNAIETSGSYSQLDGTIEKVLTNPVSAFYSTLGLTQTCRDTGQCVKPATNVMKNVVELGNNLIDTSMQAITAAAGVAVVSKAVDLFSSSKAEDKGNIKAKSLKSKLTSGLNKLNGVTGIVSGLTAYLMTFVLILGILFGKVMPLVFNLPFVSAHALIVIVDNMLPVLINFFGVWLALANDNNNFKAIASKIGRVALVIFFLPTLLTYVKILSFVTVSTFIYIIVEMSYSAMTIEGIVDELILITFIGFSLLALITSVATLCWGIIGMFFNIAGLQSFLGNEPLKIVSKINDLFSKVMPGISTAREAFRNEFNRGLRRFSRK